MANETTVPTAKPTTLAAWIKRLDDVLLPVPQASHERVCKGIRDSRSSLRDIAELMQNSPALVLSVMREANSHTHGSLTAPAENLEVALNRLGLKRAEELLARLPSVPAPDIPVALRQLLLQQAGWQQASEGLFIARERHVQALHQVREHLEIADAHLAAQAQNLDLLAEELRLGQNALNAITGEFSADDLLGVIFSSFCIGK
mgnify:CR=1 FL=1